MRHPAVLAVLALACSAGTPAPPCPGGGPCVFEQTTKIWEVNPHWTIDLLVVMDDSASMAAQQDALAARLAPEFNKIPGGLPELRVKVIRSSMPAAGLSGFPGCGPGIGQPPACVPATGDLRATQLCGQQSNYGGPFTDAFTCAARVGSDGCGWEQPLAAIRAALEGDPQDGSRFLRRDAFLDILIITDEDDCSAPPGSTLFGALPTSPDDPALAYRCHEAGIRCGGKRLSEAVRGADLSDCAPAADGGGLVPIGDYVEFLRGLKQRPDQQLVVSVLAGWPVHHGLVDAGEPALRPACARDGSPVLPAVRLGAFVEAFGHSGQLIDLCDPTDPVEAALHPFFERLAVRLPHPCLPGNIADGDPARPGIQPSCVVSERTLDLSGQAIAEQFLPACETGAGLPCWRGVTDNACTGGLKFEIDRGGCLGPGGTQIAFRCVTDPGRSGL